MKIEYKKLKIFCNNYWDLKLRRCEKNPDSLFKSGYELAGIFPGEGFRVRHFKTLKDVARYVNY